MSDGLASWPRAAWLIAAALAAPGVSWAAEEAAEPQQAAQEKPAKPQAAGQRPGRIIRVAEITGAVIRDPQGDKLGKVEEVILDEYGNLRYAVMAHGGTLGIGDKWIVIPWQALRGTPGAGQYTLDMSKEQLAKGPSVAKGQWQKFEDEAWKREVYEFYGFDYAQMARRLEPSFDELDADNDGRVSRSEVEHVGTLTQRFSRVDSDGDGEISYREFAAFEAQEAEGAQVGQKDPSEVRREIQPGDIEMVEPPK